MTGCANSASEAEPSAAAGSEAVSLGRVNIIAPAAPGSGWDQSARAVQDALQTAGVVDSAEVTNVPGASGTVALAQVAPQEGESGLLVMSGLAMMSGIITNGTGVTLDNLTPIARLIGESEVIVVPEGSPYEDLDSLFAAIKKDPASISIAGGSAGSADHVFIGLLAQEYGIDPTEINYVAFSGGGEATTALLGNQVVAGIAGTGEFQEMILAGKLHGLVVSSLEPVASLPDVPTMTDAGLPDLEFANWRSIMAPPGITAAEKEAYIAAIVTMHASAGWKETLTTNAWQDLLITGSEFGDWLDTENERVTGVLTDLGLAQ
ncbi:tripartite tricarboxylate transporter substrate binding protein [Cryobacterium flavum]|uniref:Tripartite tricarboxylate transporter substrate binding protein n=1 Tax=Cryobacterium flavum TaxID=1424659 RepID=A0ABY2IA03_9MICO|nr:tripartite tricarboxylate transporter substrate binding protein [Cryobacterium flavum]